MSETDMFRKIWAYLKKGRSEIWFLIGIYNTIQLWSIKNTNINGILLLISIMIVFCIVVGWFTIKKVDPTSIYVSPYAQDSILSAMLANEGLIRFMKGDNDKAIAIMYESQDLRKKWAERGVNIKFHEIIISV